MTALEIARANVASAALERCLRIVRRGGFCSRLTFQSGKVGTDFDVIIRFGGIPFVVVLVLTLVAHLR